jgi:hypothetical protein
MLSDYDKMSNLEIKLLYSISKRNKENAIQKLKYFIENIKKYKEKIKIAQNKLDKADRKYIRLCESYFNENIYDLKDAEYNMDICELKLLKITNELKFYVSMIPSKKSLLNEIRRVTENFKYLEIIYNDRFIN